MKKASWILFAASPFLAGIGLADGPSAAAPPALTIAAEARCVDSAGIPIQEVPDNQVKLACLRDKTVQSQCNPDGHHARIQAFRSWTYQLADFRERCASVGGVFSFADPGFQEPSNETFCSAAQPEVRYNPFETPLCNFVSQCPNVAVTCSQPEDLALQTAKRNVSLPGIPNPIHISD